MPGTIHDRAQAEAWLSSARFEIYLSRAQHDTERALLLYEWNAKITAALLQDIGHLEVLLRNKYDHLLTASYPDWTTVQSPLWMLETGLERTKALQRNSNQGSRGAIRKARSGARTHGHVVANLTFGFWPALTRSEREATIWTPMIRTVFPGFTRGEVHDRMEKLNVFRNRLAHWEPVFSRTTGLMRQIQLMDDMYLALDADVRRWVGQHSDVPETLSRMPEAVLARWTGPYLGHS